VLFCLYMIYKEEQLATGAYQYTGEDVRGKAVITSATKMEGSQLDQAFTAIVNSGLKAGNIGEFVTFVFTPPSDHIHTLDIFNIIPDLKDGTTVEQLIAAIAQSMSPDQLAAFRESLTAMGRIELEIEVKIDQ